MTSSGAPRTLGVVTVDGSAPADAEWHGIRRLRAQVDELLIVVSPEAGDVPVAGGDGRADDGVLSILLDTDGGPATAWNAGLSTARERHHEYLYIVGRDSGPAGDSVTRARAQMERDGTVAVVQQRRTPRRSMSRFPSDGATSGWLFQVDALDRVGGFDERLFPDEAAPEMLTRLLGAGYRVETLATATATTPARRSGPARRRGSTTPEPTPGVERRRLQGYSAGIRFRRSIRSAPGTAVGLLGRQVAGAGADVVRRERRSASALLAGVLAGFFTARPPVRAPERSCPYCGGALLGRYGAVEDWRFGTGARADVYRCRRCGALVAGRVPGRAELASWYSDYYTHTAEVSDPRSLSWLWPTPARRRELERLRWYFASPGSTGRFLEVGTGSGERLVQFADAGWVVVGQDLDENAGGVARRRGIEIETRPVAELADVEEPFDLIGLSHVLEHAEDPAGLLRSCASLLAPGGRLCVISPNADAFGRLLFGRWWFGLEQPRHLGIPTLASLEAATSDLGLKVISARTVAANANVVLGRSLGRPFHGFVPPGRLRRLAELSTALVGQAVGRTATTLHPRLGEEVVWLGQRPQP